MSPDAHIIFGPPGCGKTTALLNKVEFYLQQGLNPADIVYIGFTKRAAGEARERAMVKFSFSEEQLPWFRTFHSLAFGMMMLNKDNIVTTGDKLAVAKHLGLCITVTAFNEDEGVFIGQTKGDRLFFAEAMARSRMMPLKDYFDSIPDEDLYYYELLQLRETYETYKQKYNKLDFTDIITTYAADTRFPAPAAKVLIVDEAQDLSPLQWKMVHKLSDSIGTTYIAGDDDQAIFRWAGADVEKFIDLPSQRTILTTIDRSASS